MSQDQTKLAKMQLRLQYTARRQQISFSDRMQMDGQIGEHMNALVHRLFAEKKAVQPLVRPQSDISYTVAFYQSTRTEVNLGQAFDRLRAAGICVVYPRVNRQQKLLDFYEVAHLQSLLPGYMDILEPDPSAARWVDISQIDLFFIPGLSFTRHGERLGYGGGFYDRMLSLTQASAIRVGICYAVQLAEALPVESHDERMDYILTEQGVLSCPQSPSL